MSPRASIARPRAALLLAALVLAALVAAGCAHTAPPAAANRAGLVRVALMPIEDLGEEGGGAFQVQGLLERDLPGRGYEVVDEAALKRLLLRERIRRAGAVGLEFGRTLGRELGAPFILLVAVTQYQAGTSPCVGLAARLIEADSGDIVWTGAASATGAEFQRLLGLGKIEDVSKLAERVVSMLLASLPEAGSLARSTTSGGAKL